jgi:YfiH family protein
VPSLQTYATAAGVAAFSGRMGGLSTGRFAEANLSRAVGDDPSAVDANRSLLMRALDRRHHRLVTAEQRHSATVVTADPTQGADSRPRADGLITRDTDAVLMVGVADCVPVVLLAPGVGGVLHAGRRSILQGIVGHGVAAMGAAGADPGSLTAVVGPAIGACCYPVGDDVRATFLARHPGAAARSRHGRPALDLRAAVAAVLGAAGVARVVHFADCTAHSPDRYFSRRRDGPNGCQAGVVALAV